MRVSVAAGVLVSSWRSRWLATGTASISSRERHHSAAPGSRCSTVELHTLKADEADEPHPSTLHTDWSERDFQDYISLILGVIDTEGLDVLHYHYAVPFAFVAQRLQDHLGDAMPRLVGTLHGTDVTAFGKAPNIGPRLAKVLQSSDLLTTVSNSHAQLAAIVFDLPGLPHVIPNFVDLSRFWPAARERPCAQAQLRPRLVHVSNFRRVKDPQSMARTFLDIRARMEAELWLIGDGEELPAVRAIFEESAFADDVRYLGLKRDVATYLRHTDLLLMTSLYESFCLVALEAMACGVPVLATEVGGLPEVVAHGQTGMLFPLGDYADGGGYGRESAVRSASAPGDASGGYPACAPI